MVKDLTVTDLCPCDILLYHGDSPVSQLIQWFDGSEYSHASIFDGEMVVEAISEGVRRRSVAVTMEDTLFVDVWRLRKDGDFIGSPQLPAQPVLDAIIRFVEEGDRYAFEELLLLALLCTSRRLPLPFLRWSLDHAASAIVDMVDAGKEPMTCSELVYRCFTEAGEAYRPRITGVDIRAKIEIMHAPGKQVKAMTDADRLVAEFLERYAASKNLATRDALLMAALEADPNFVTPKDLRKSPDLVKTGRLASPS